MALSESDRPGHRNGNPDIVSANWRSVGNLVVLNGCINLTIRTSLYSIEYESRCFQVLSSMRAFGKWIGPHLTDHLLGGTVRYSDKIRPDAIRFDQVGPDWCITGLAEFKSGTKNGTSRKLGGFSELLSDFRSDGVPFIRRIDDVLGDCIEPPRNLIIPPDEKIEVFMVSPYNDPKTVYEGQLGFVVRYMNVPLDSDH